MFKPPAQILKGRCCYSFAQTFAWDYFFILLLQLDIVQDTGILGSFWGMHSTFLQLPETMYDMASDSQVTGYLMNLWRCSG